VIYYYYRMFNADQLNLLQAKIDLGSGASLARFNRQLGIADDRLAAVSTTANKAAVGISGAFDKTRADLAASHREPRLPPPPLDSL
jgi:hypothetical protein